VRRSCHDPGNVNKTKKAIKTAFQAQLNGLGFSMVEVLSACPVNWNLTPTEALHYVEEMMVVYYPLGDFKVADAVKNI
jgi:2-oxoglutarate ferredoxin oxidoreductase subunit beta